MKGTLDIDVTSFYQTQFKSLKWRLNDQTADGREIVIEEESRTDRDHIRGALEDHLDHITASLPVDHVLNDYEVSLSFDPQVAESQKTEFTKVFNEFNTRDESN